MQNEKVLEIGYTARGIYSTILNCTLKNGSGGKFYVICILPQLKIIKLKGCKNKKKIAEMNHLIEFVILNLGKPQV